MSSSLNEEINKRRTFAIISHPDAGKTTLTEKLLLYGGAIQLAGTVKGRKAKKHATSDWMELEKQRGISVTTSVMQFPYHNRILNLLDTPGHEDFSEDTYRTLTAVDSALMVIDGAKGVEERTIKLLDVCRLRKTPVMTFINKLDRECRSPVELLDEIEAVLKIHCAPVTWPIGQGKRFKGIYHILEDRIYLYQSGKNEQLQTGEIIAGIENPLLSEKLGELVDELRIEMDLIRGASHQFDSVAYQAGDLTPVFFGSAINNFGIQELLNMFVKQAPAPLPRQTLTREIVPTEQKFSGFVFKIQANMDPQHHDRIAFVRICSGKFTKGMRVFQSRLNKVVPINQVLTFMAGERQSAEVAYAGDIIGFHNHGTIQIGDTFSEGEALQFIGIPSFAPELFRLVRLKDPLKSKALVKGLTQLAEEGATQLFKPIDSNDLIVGAVGDLQFDVVKFRLKHEYRVECAYEHINVVTARWVHCEDKKILPEFMRKMAEYLAYDGGNRLTYLAPTNVHLNLTLERWPQIQFLETCEVIVPVA